MQNAGLQYTDAIMALRTPIKTTTRKKGLLIKGLLATIVH